MKLLFPMRLKEIFSISNEKRSPAWLRVKMWLLASVSVLLLLSSCQSSKDAVGDVELYNIDGDSVGTATLTEQSGGVTIKLKAEGLSPGFHGVHVHEFPVCEGPIFKSAGNHWNPEGKEHGLLHPEGAHLGDLQNIEVDSDGSVDVELLLNSATLLEGKKSLLKEGGTSLVITEGEDDGMSQPSGDSGARIVCGEIKSDAKKESSKSPTDPTETNEKEEEES